MFEKNQIFLSIGVLAHDIENLSGLKIWLLHQITHTYKQTYNIQKWKYKIPDCDWRRQKKYVFEIKVILP